MCLSFSNGAIGLSDKTAPMLRLVVPVRQLARASQRAALGQREWLSAVGASRRLATAQLAVGKEAVDPQTRRDLYARISNKMSGLFAKQDYQIEVIEEKIADVVEYLQSRFKISEVSAIRIVALHPMITTYTIETMERKLQWLLNAGLDLEMVKIAVRRHPMILGRSEESLEATRNWFLKQGIAPSKIPFLLSCCPHAVSFSEANNDSKLETLRKIGLNDEHIRRVLQRFPQILQRANDQMLAKVEIAKDMGFSEDSIVRLVTLVPEFLALSMDQVKVKVKAFEEMFGPGRGMEVWAMYPRLIMCNQTQLRRSFDFLTQVADVDVDRITSNIGIIMRNADRVLRPRYEFLKSRRSPELERMRWIGLSDAHFHERYPGFKSFLENEYKPSD